MLVLPQFHNTYTHTHNIMLFFCICQCKVQKSAIQRIAEALWAFLSGSCVLLLCKTTQDDSSSGLCSDETFVLCDGEVNLEIEFAECLLRDTRKEIK